MLRKIPMTSPALPTSPTRLGLSHFNAIGEGLAYHRIVGGNMSSFGESWLLREDSNLQTSGSNPVAPTNTINELRASRAGPPISSSARHTTPVKSRSVRPSTSQQLRRRAFRPLARARQGGHEASA